MYIIRLVQRKWFQTVFVPY
jgi:hypothetical protein